MLILCSACKSKYLVNSADLKPSGRTVQCARCGHNWFQTSNVDNEENEDVLRISDPLSKNKDSNRKNNIPNLPTTYVQKKKASVINSILVVFSIFVLIGSFWFINKNGINVTILVNFYIQEFFFNFKLMINDLAKIIHQILN